MNIGMFSNKIFQRHLKLLIIISTISTHAFQLYNPIISTFEFEGAKIDHS
jgi:hypothetical protein